MTTPYVTLEGKAKRIAATAGLTVGTRRDNTGGVFRYTGVLRRGRRVVAECGHTHLNRDITTGRSRAAAECIARQIIAAGDNTFAGHEVAAIRIGWQYLTRGFSAPADTIANAKAECAAEADAYPAKLAALTALLDSTTTARR